MYSTEGPSAPPHPASQSLYPNIDPPSIFSRDSTDSPRNNGSSYFSSIPAGSSGYPPVHPPPPANGRATPTHSPVKPTSAATQPTRSPLRSQPVGDFDVTVTDPSLVTEPSPIAVPGTAPDPGCITHAPAMCPMLLLSSGCDCAGRFFGCSCQTDLTQSICVHHASQSPILQPLMSTAI